MTYSVVNTFYEFTEREISAAHRENVGAPYRRAAYIADLAIDAQIEAALAPIEVCTFHNIHGWCKMTAGHEGKHTVIYLGAD